MRTDDGAGTKGKERMSRKISGGILAAGNRGYRRRKSDIATLISSVNDGKMWQLHPGGTSKGKLQRWSGQR